MKIVLQGMEGSYSQQACNGYFHSKKTQIQCVQKFFDIFSRVAKGRADYGVVPIENTLTGSLRDNYNLFHQFPCHIVGEIIVKINHHLLAAKNTKLGAIARVYSHPQALQQCELFLAKNLPKAELIPFFDTAAAAEFVAREDNPTYATLANAQAAKHYQLKMLRKSVSDNKQNFTRFFVIKKGKRPTQKNKPKTSIHFCLKNIPGALHRCLSIFSIRDVDLSRIESAPIMGKPWEYRFYVDVVRPLSDNALIKAIEHLKEISTEVVVMGNYDLVKVVH